MAPPVEPIRRILRILSGPHNGAEMSLLPGRYIIGRDKDCDIVLSDAALAAQHAALVIDGDSVIFEPLEGSALGADGAVDQQIPLADFNPIVIGATALALGPQKETWPTIELPKPDQSSILTVDTEPELSEPDLAPVSRPIPPKPTTKIDTEQPDRLAIGQFRGASLLVVVGVGVVIIISALIGLHAVESTSSSDTAESGEAEPLKTQVTKIISNLGFADDLEVTETSRNGEETVTVTGYVKTEDDRRSVIAQLQSYRQQVQTQIWSTDLLRSSVQQALSGMRIPLQVTSVDKGVVVLSGVLDDSTSLNSLQSNLKSDVPGISEITLQVASMPDAILWLRQKAQQRQIVTSELKFKPNASNLTVSGQLEDDQSADWKKTTSEFETHFENEITLLDQVTFVPKAVVEEEQQEAPVEPEKVNFNLSIRAINVGPPGYVTMANGEKYLVGSRLSNGMILDKVETNGMVLLDGDKRHLVRVASNTGRVSEVTELPKE